MEFSIETTELSKDKRSELAKTLFECGYSVKLVKKKDGTKQKYYIVCKE